MLIDSHAHLGRLIEDPLARKKVEAHPLDTAEAYIAAMDEAGVDMGVSLGRLDLDNAYQAEIQKRYPDRIISFGFINPRAADAEDELKRCLGEYGLKGVYFNGFRHAYSNADHTLLDPLMKIIEGHKVPVMMHTQGDNTFTPPIATEQMARAFPEITFLMGHSGNIWLADEGSFVAGRTENIITDTCYVEAFRITYNSKNLPKERIVFGSNWPWNDLKSQIDYARRCIQNEEIEEWVMGRSLAKILGIGG